ncbi:MAG: nitroreductase/quinone reductase family protein [Haloferacaceae archaeon]
MADASAPHVSPLQRAVEDRIANPLFRALLRSPLHPLASRWLVLVTYEGRRTGRRHTLSALYDRRDGDAVVVTPRGASVWWRNFSSPRRCTVRIRGTERTAVGELLTGDDREAALADYLDRYGFVGRLFGGVDAGRSDGPLASLAVVRFRPVDGPATE